MNANSVPMLVSSSAWSWVTKVGASPTKHAGQDRSAVRRAKARVHARERRRQQAVARHREQDARLAELEHQQHRGHGDDRAQRHQRRRARHADRKQRARERIAGVELLVRHEPGHHRGDRDVEDAADQQRRDHGARQIALRIARLLGDGGDRVEADVRKERQRRAGPDAVKSGGRERVPVGGLHELGADADERRHQHQLQRHHRRVEARALAHADHQQHGQQRDNQRGRQVERDRERAERRRQLGRDRGDRGIATADCRSDAIQAGKSTPRLPRRNERK